MHIGRFSVELQFGLLRQAWALRMGAVRDNIHLAEAARFLGRFLGPDSAQNVIGMELRSQQIERHHGELQVRTALQEEHLVARRHAEQAAQQALRLGQDRDELFAAVAGLHDGVTPPVPVQKFLLGGLQHGLRQYSRTGREVVDAGQGAAFAQPSAAGASGDPFSGVDSAVSCPLPASLSRSTTRCSPDSVVPSSSAISVTPCVARPISRISATRVRISTPPVVISITSSSPRTSVAATTLPLRSLVAMAIMPLVPRPCRVYSAIGVRLPKPFSVAVSTLCSSSSATSMAMTCWPSSSCMPRTPRAVRPMGRTSFSSKRTALPASENSMTSCCPSVMAAPIR